MRKLMFAFAAGALLIMTGCLKNDDNNPNSDCSTLTATAPVSEVTTLKAYLDSINVHATQDSRGFFYTIDSSASTTAEHPTPCSAITAAYVGKLTNDSTFDSASVAAPASFGLYDSRLLTGWREALPLMKTNAIMYLYLPPSLAYGATGYPGVIPANAILYFRIQLLAIAN